MANIFYRGDNGWITQKEGDHREIIAPPGKYTLITDVDSISIVGVKSGMTPLLLDALVTSIEKNDLGGYYSDVDEFKGTNAAFFAGISSVSSVSLINGEGNGVDAHHPLQTTLNMLYAQDIDWEASDFTGWIGEPKGILGNINNEGIYNDSTDNPKSFTLRLIRTRQGRSFGIGANIGNFSNMKVSFLGSGDAIRGQLSQAEEPAKKTSFVYSEEEFIFNGIKIEFLTADRVDVTNIYTEYTYSSRKQDYVLKFGLNPDIDAGLPETIWTLGDIYQFTTTPQDYYISSSNSGDTQIIEGELIVASNEGRYVRENYSVQLDGQNPVKIPITGDLLCVASNRAHNNSSTPLSGDIYIYEQTPVSGGVPDDLGKVRSHISQGSEQTEQAVYTIPEFLEDGRSVIFAEIYLWGGEAIRNRTMSGIMKLLISEKGKTPRIQSNLGLSENTSSRAIFGENTPLVVKPGSDVYVNADEVSTDNVVIQANFTIKLVVS